VGPQIDRSGDEQPQMRSALEEAREGKPLFSKWRSRKLVHQSVALYRSFPGTPLPISRPSLDRPVDSIISLQWKNMTPQRAW
jgi:hypothetical protein